MTEDELAYAKRFNSTVTPRFFSPASANIPFEEVFAQSDCEMLPVACGASVRCSCAALDHCQKLFGQCFIDRSRADALGTLVSKD
jgi:hypothetical protein